MALFVPFRALGCITDDVPFAVQRRGRETFVTVAVGHAWQTFNCARLLLVAASPQLGGAITALAAVNDATLAAVGADIHVFERVHRAATWRGHTAPILQLLPLGPVVLSLGRDRRLLVWNIGKHGRGGERHVGEDGAAGSAPAASASAAPSPSPSATPLRSLRLPEGFTPTVMAHPDTYVNKILIGSAEGGLQLWNFSTGSMLYAFAGWGAGVVSLAAAPALDVVAVGLADGRIQLHNLKYDEPAAPTLVHGPPAGGAVRALAFRTGAGPPLLAAGGVSGAVSVWDLEKRQLSTLLPAAHDAPVTALHFFAGEPLLMTSGGDNALKHWLFDSADGAARLLRFRAGHAAPPACLSHYGDGLRLLSAGRDRAFRVFSTIQDQQSRELSQGHVGRRAKRLHLSEEEVKLPRVTAMAACEVRERDWANVVTAHEGAPEAYTWLLAKAALGERALRPPTADGAPVTSVGISACGNFALVGTAAGTLDRFNLQSGAHRAAYQRGFKAAPQAFEAAVATRVMLDKGAQGAVGPAGRKGATQFGRADGRVGGRPAAGAAGARPAHDGAVVGVSSDSCNKLLVSAGFDGCLRVWSFRTLEPVGELSAGVPLGRLAAHRSNALAAAAGDDLLIRVWDYAALRLVRRFRGHQDRITDLQFSADARWLLSSSMDSTVRIWDVPGGRPLQALRLDPPVTALSLSPAMDLLATAHVHRRGVFLWANRLVYSGGADADVPAAADPVALRMPTVADGDDGASGVARGRAAPAGSSDSEEDSDDDSEVDSEAEDARPKRLKRTPAAAAAPSAATDTASAGPADSVAEAAAAAAAPAQLGPELVTLALLPRSQWHALLHLEAIKARNKPIQPPTKPEAAPFFLPTLAGLSAQPVFDLTAPAAAPAAEGGAAAEPKSRILDHTKDRRKGLSAEGSLLTGDGLGSAFMSRVAEGAASGDWAPALAELRSLSAPAMDAEIRTLALAAGGRAEELTAADEAGLARVLRFAEAVTAGGRDFELMQAFLRVFLEVHGELLAGAPALRARAAALRARVRGAWRRLDGLFQSVRCMLGYFGNVN